MRDITKEELKVILENHKHWISGDIEGCENMRADLSNVNLEGADLNDADLYGANLSWAKLKVASKADLRGTNLKYAKLRGADLSGAKLSDANLKGANLEGADLRDVDLRDAILVGASLKNANLKGADLSGADLRDADLSSADLSGAKLNVVRLRCTNLRNANLSEANLDGADLNDADLSGAKNVPYIPMTCPDTGAFVGWKVCVDRIIVKLLIPEDAKRSSATGRKCRCDKAIVLDIEGADKAYSIFYNKFVYRKGETVTVSNFNDDRFVECGAGIHFFINKEEAINFANNIPKKS